MILAFIYSSFLFFYTGILSLKLSFFFYECELKFLIFERNFSLTFSYIQKFIQKFIYKESLYILVKCTKTCSPNLNLVILVRYTWTSKMLFFWKNYEFPCIIIPTTRDNYFYI